MTYKTDDDKKDNDGYNYNKNEDGEIIVDAVEATKPNNHKNEAPIPAGHSRFYCEKCHTPYDLPDRATSWRCMRCQTFNSTTPGQCEWCSIL